MIDGKPYSEHPEVKKAAEKADARADATDQPWAVWVRPNTAITFVMPDDDRLADCVLVYSTEEGWL